MSEESARPPEEPAPAVSPSAAPSEPAAPRALHPLHLAVRPPRRLVRRVLTWLFVLVVVVVGAAVVVINTDWFANQIRVFVEEELSDLLDAEVHIERLSFRLLPTVGVVEGVSIRKRGTPRVLLLRRAEARIRPLALLRRHVDLERVVVEGAEVTLDLHDGRAMNVPLPKAPPKGGPKWEVTLDRASLRKADIHAIVRGSAGPGGEPLRRALATVAKLRARPIPTGAATLVVRLGGLEVDVHRRKGSWDSRLQIVAGAVDGPGLHESLGRLRSKARYSDVGTLSVDHLEVELNAAEMALLVRGVARDVFALAAGKGGRVEGKVVLALDVGAARRAYPRLPEMEGTLKLDVDGVYSGRRAFEASGQVEWQDAKIAEHRLGEVRVAVAANPVGLRFRDLRTEFAKSALRGSGSVTFESEPRVEAKVSFRELQLSRLLRALSLKEVPVDLVPSGELDVRGRIRRPGGRIEPDLVAQTDIVVRDLIVRRGIGNAPKALFIPDAKVDGRVQIRGSRIVFEGMGARIGRSDIRVRGTVDAKRETVSLDILAPDMRLESVGTIAGMPWSGRGHVRASVRGTFDAPHVLGSFDFEGLSFLGYDVDRAAGQVDFAGRDLALPIVAAARGQTRLFGSAVVRLDGSDGIEADFDIPRGNTRDLLKLMRLPPIYGNRYAADLTGQVHVRGRIPKPNVWGELRATDALVYNEPIHEVYAKAAYTDQGVAIETVRVRKTKDAGDVLLTGTIGKKGELDFKAVSKDFTLTHLDVPALKVAGLEGQVDLEAQVKGVLQGDETLASLVGDGHMYVRKAKIKGRAHKDTRLDLKIAGGKLHVDAKVLGEGLRLAGDMKLEAPYPISGKVDLHAFDLGGVAGERVAKIVRPIDGSGHISGVLSQLESLRGDFTLTRVHADLDAAYALTNRRPIVVALEKGRVRIESFELEGRETLLMVTGGLKLNGELDCNVEGRADMRLLGYFVPKLQQPGGVVSFKSQVRGDVRRPVLLGQGRIAGGRLGIEALPHRVTDIEAKLGFSQGKVLLTELVGKFADGTLRGDGELVLDRKPISFRASVRLDEAGLRFVDYMPARVAGNFQLAGTFEEQLLTGEVQVARARYTKDLKIEELLFRKRRPTIAPVYEKGKERLRFDIHVTARDDLRMINNVGDLEFQGDVHVRGSPQRFGLAGAARLVRPGTIKLFKKVFKVERCFAIFKETDGIIPHIDCEAATRVRNIDVVFPVRGLATEVTVKPECGASLAAADCFSLVQVGLTLRELNSVPGRSGGTLGAELFLGLTGFDEKVAENLPIFDTFRIASGYSEYSATIVPLVTVGKEIFSGFRVYGTTSLIEPSKDFRAQLEYDLARNLSIVGEYVNLSRSGSSGNVGSGLGNLGADLRWRFEF